MFTEQTLVNTKDGMKELSKVTTNDYVLTAQQTYEKVSEVKKKASHGVYRIQTQGNPELYADGETLFRVRTKLKNGKDGREFSNEKWVKAKNLTKHDYILISKNRKSPKIRLLFSIYPRNIKQNSRKLAKRLATPLKS